MFAYTPLILNIISFTLMKHKTAKDSSETNAITNKTIAQESLKQMMTADGPNHDSLLEEAGGDGCPVSHEMSGFRVPDDAIFGSSRRKELEVIEEVK